MKIENKLVIAGTVAIIAIILVGQLCMNMGVKNDYSLDYDGDVVMYEIDLGYVSNYSVVSFDDGGLGRNTNFIACYDQDHSWYKSFGYIGNTLEHLTKNMENRGLSIDILDTDSIKVLLESEIDNGESDTTLVFVTGSFPEEIWDGTDESVLLEWLEIGGDLVWGSGPMGYYMSTDSECILVENDPGTVFFGVEGAVNNSDNRVRDNTYYAEGLSEIFRLYYSETTWGVEIGITDDQLVTEYEVDGYAALSSTKYCGGSGSITVFGGDVDNNTASYMAQYMASGLGYCSTIIDYHIGVAQNASGTLKVSETDPAIFLSIGLMNDNIVLYRDLDSIDSVKVIERF